MEKKQKRFYKIDEVVWVVDEKKEGKILKLNKDKLEVDVQIKEGNISEVVTKKMWEIDKLKYKAKEKFVKQKIKTGQLSEHNEKVPTVYFAKVRDNAIIPSKRLEDAGYDVYANFKPEKIDGKDVFELYCPAHQTTLVPTGIAMALPNTHYFNVKHERGSTAKQSMSVLAGVVDSGYRGEIFIAMTPLHKDVIITSETEEVEVSEHAILYPYKKAVAQGTIDLVPKVNIEIIAYEDLEKIESLRGKEKLGQSGK